MILIKRSLSTTFAVHLPQEHASSYRLRFTPFDETMTTFSVYESPEGGYNERACVFTRTFTQAVGMYLVTFEIGSTPICTHIAYITDEPLHYPQTFDSFDKTIDITYYDA